MIPGENTIPSIGISGLKPVWLKAEKGNMENGTAVYSIEKKVCARESKGLSTFRNNSMIIIIDITGIITRNQLLGTHPSATVVEMT